MYRHRIKLSVSAIMACHMVAVMMNFLSRSGDTLETKYLYVCHAELNAILNASGRDLHGCRIYVPLFPCNECAKAIIQSGITKVLYLSDKYSETDIVIASKRMLMSAGVELVKLEPELEEICISFKAEDV